MELKIYFIITTIQYKNGIESKYSLNVKRVKWLLFNRVKITLKTSENQSKVSENHSKKSVNHSKKSENHSNRVYFPFWGSSQRDSSFVSSCPSVRSPLKWNSLYWSDFHSFLEWFSLTLEWFSFVLRVIFTRLECFLRFSLYWRVTISLFLH